MSNRIKKLKKTKEPSTPPGGASQHKKLIQAKFFHRRGELRQAEILYRQILAVDPSHAEALNLFGLLAHQMGRNDFAVELLQRAVNCRSEYSEAHNNLGSAFLALGKFEEAIASYQRALYLKPDFVDVHYNLGITFNAFGQPEKAVESFRHALSLEPDSAEVHYNLGVVFQALGKFEEAVASYRRAIELRPEFVDAHYNLGVVFYSINKLAEAVANYRQVLILKPDHAWAHYNLGVVLADQGKMAEAIASYKEALSIKADFPEAHANIAVIQSELGQIDEAVDSFKQALAIKPDCMLAYKGLADIVKHTEYDETVRAMEELIAKKGEMLLTDRIILGKALGKVFEDLGEYGKSFEFIVEANRLQRGRYQYSTQNDRDFFSRIKKTFSPNFFASRHGCGSQDKTPLFIMGMPRSGTSLAEQILASHPQVFGGGELRILPNLVADDLYTCGTSGQFPESVLMLKPEAFGRLGEAYVERIREYATDEKFITDKLPHNFLYVGLIKAILPEAKVIHCRRDPMDNCFSIFTKDFKARHDYAHDLVELGEFYNLYRDLMAHWEKVLPGFMYTIQYEEMVADQKRQTERLLEYCGLPWDEACLDFYRTQRRVTTASFAQVRRPIYRDSIERWKRYEKLLEPLRKTISDFP